MPVLTDFAGAVSRLAGWERRGWEGGSGAGEGQPLGGVVHTWKHFSASLRATRAYYYNYSFKAAAICIRRAPAQPAGPRGPAEFRPQRPLSR